MEYSKASEYTGAFSVIEERVKPERLKKDANKYPRMVNEWWKFWINKKELRDQLVNLERVLCQCRTSKTHAFVFCNTDQLFSTEVIVVTDSRYCTFAILQSSLHEIWTWRYCSTFKGDRRYSPTDCFINYPFPNQTKELISEIGERYHEYRRTLMLRLWLGLTDIYNLFHNRDLAPAIVAKVSGKPDEAEAGYQGILELRKLHRELDEAVLAAYGWTDLNLGHDFHEVETLPENDRVRYTISPEARKELLKRLLALNHQRAAEEEAKKPVKADKSSKGKAAKAKKSTEDEKQLGLGV